MTLKRKLGKRTIQLYIVVKKQLGFKPTQYFPSPLFSILNFKNDTTRSNYVAHPIIYIFNYNTTSTQASNNSILPEEEQKNSLFFTENTGKSCELRY